MDKINQFLINNMHTIMVIFMVIILLALVGAGVYGAIECVRDAKNKEERGWWHDDK